MPKNPLCSLIFYHGAGAHGSAGYLYLAEKLCSEYNVATFLFDIRGHGLSEGARGHTPSIIRVWKDIDNACTHIKQRLPDIHLFLGGHSSGAGLILNHSIQAKITPIDGYVFIAPNFGPQVPVQTPIMTQFATVKTIPFIIHKLTGGLLAGNWNAITFNYSRLLQEQFNLVNTYTINMAHAVTPVNPKKSLSTLDKKTFILLAEHDELLGHTKMTNYVRTINNNNITTDHSDEKHLTILDSAHKKIGSWLNGSRNTP
jgi:pimeloyl-ACP methyl ester carboxylesterase